VENRAADVAFREAEVEDWPAISGLLGRRPDEGQDLRRYLQREYESCVSWVAMAQDGTVLGAAVAGVRAAPVPSPESRVPSQESTASSELGTRNPEQGEGRLVWIGVTPRRRRQGIGTRLLDLILDELRARRLAQVTLLVQGTQVEALALFRKAGFGTTGQSLGLILPPEAGAALVRRPPSEQLRPLTLEDVPLLSGLLIQLGIERAPAPHDELPSLTPAQVEDWLQRPATVAYAAWEARDPQTPVGLAWATRRADDALLRFVGVQEDERGRGHGRALVAALVAALAHRRSPAGASAAGGAAALADAPRLRPLRAQLNDPGAEQEFFRRLGFEAEQITYRMARPLAPSTGER
jgi:ribosomal protein S18 acetylase RimI-like enzyme